MSLNSFVTYLFWLYENAENNYSMLKKGTNTNVTKHKHISLDPIYISRTTHKQHSTYKYTFWIKTTNERNQQKHENDKVEELNLKYFCFNSIKVLHKG